MMQNLKFKIRFLFIYIEIEFVKILKIFKIKRSTAPIPDGTPYCYLVDVERNEKEPINGYWIKPCKYYRNLNRLNAACTYVGYIGFDPCLADQCKICGEKEGFDEE